MAAIDDEEKLLRSVALQNANSILLARQRAEQELIQAKEALERKTEELAHSLSMMRATLESTTDGIVVTDDGGKVTGFNEKFVEMWRCPAAIMDSKEHRQMLEFIAEQFKDPREFLARGSKRFTQRHRLKASTCWSLPTAGVFERFSKIQFVDERNVGPRLELSRHHRTARAEEALAR